MVECFQFTLYSKRGLKMRKIALRGLIGQKRNTLLLWSVVTLAFLFLVLSTTLITSLNKTDEEQRRSTYGSWQIMVSDSDLSGIEFADENSKIFLTTAAPSSSIHTVFFFKGCK